MKIEVIAGAKNNFNPMILKEGDTIYIAGHPTLLEGEYTFLGMSPDLFKMKIKRVRPPHNGVMSIYPTSSALFHAKPERVVVSETEETQNVVLMGPTSFTRKTEVEVVEYTNLVRATILNLDGTDKFESTGVYRTPEEATNAAMCRLDVAAVAVPLSRRKVTREEKVFVRH